MKKLPYFPPRNICIAAGALLCALPAGVGNDKIADAANDLARKFDTTNFYAEKVWSARKTGNWENGDIWWAHDPLEGVAKAQKVKGKQYANSSKIDADIAGKGNIVTLSSNAEVRYFRIYHEKTALILEDNAHLRLHGGFLGHRGASSGGIRVSKGAHFESLGVIILAGTNLADTGTGTFAQTGGTVSTLKSLALTGISTQSSSPTATGVYTLSGGVLKIASADEQNGITNGLGSGHFIFEGGTLDANVVAIDIDNVKGNLSPGGDGALGRTCLVPETIRISFAKLKNLPYNEARIYTQGSKACMTINVENRRNYDYLRWQTPSGEGRVVLKPNTTIRILPLRNFRPQPGEILKLDIIRADKIELEGKLRIDAPSTFNVAYDIIDGKRLRLIIK